MASERVGVIVPFFQREPGILRRALDSVAAQTHRSGLHVVVVDDGSPVPASDDVESAALPADVTIEVIRQANGGPGAARNAGLDALGGGTGFVAFLDSDDAWTPDHLENALLALRAGCDFYFSDIQREWDAESRFRTRDDGLLDPSSLAPLVPERRIFEYRGDFEAAVLTGLVNTSSIVYRFSRAPEQRFPTRYRFFGEDQHFWLSVGASSRRLAVSLNCESRSGRGVNVWAGSRWGTEHNVQRILHEIAFRRECLSMPDLGEHARRMSRQRLAAARRSLAAEVLHHGRRGRLAVVARAVARDPATAVRLPAAALRAVGGRRGGGAGEAEGPREE